MKVISGGQTGIDRLGLEVAREMGLLTGGTAPKGYRTEDGPDPSLNYFNLVESHSSSYDPRTIQNVVDSDGTILFGNMSSQGSCNTIQYCDTYKKPHIENPNVEQFLNFVKTNKIKILNIAGNRGSKLSANQLKHYGSVIQAALGQL